MPAVLQLQTEVSDEDQKDMIVQVKKEEEDVEQLLLEDFFLASALLYAPRLIKQMQHD